jgi:hypothetical protein
MFDTLSVNWQWRPTTLRGAHSLNDSDNTLLLEQSLAGKGHPNHLLDILKNFF